MALTYFVDEGFRYTDKLPSPPPKLPYLATQGSFPGLRTAKDTLNKE